MMEPDSNKKDEYDQDDRPESHTDEGSSERGNAHELSSIFQETETSYDRWFEATSKLVKPIKTRCMYERSSLSQAVQGRA